MEASWIGNCSAVRGQFSNIFAVKRRYFVVSSGSAVTFAVTVADRTFPVTSLDILCSLPTCVLVQCVRDAVPGFQFFWSPCTANPVHCEHQEEKCKVLPSQFHKSVQQSEYPRPCTATSKREVPGVSITVQQRTCCSTPSITVLPARVPYSLTGFLCGRVLYTSMNPSTWAACLVADAVTVILAFDNCILLELRRGEKKPRHRRKPKYERLRQGLHPSCSNDGRVR